jgi:hypothetical protein
MNKFEARNPKSETDSNRRNRNLNHLFFGKFDHLSLGFDSSFDIRISDLERLSGFESAYSGSCQ